MGTECGIEPKPTFLLPRLPALYEDTDECSLFWMIEGCSYLLMPIGATLKLLMMSLLI